MDAASRKPAQFIGQLHRFVALVWYLLRSPRLTLGLVIMLGVVMLLGRLIPQQSIPVSDAAAWISTLPSWLQLWGDPLFFLGFGRLFQSLWFWLPAAFLLLNSLVALADYGPDSWRRLATTIPPIDRQHPLAHRIEVIARLPKSPDAYLTILQNSLKQHGFVLYQPAEAGQRMVGAGRRRWSWLSLLAIYAGLILVIAGFLISHYFLRIERLTVVPFEARSSQLFAGKFELKQVEQAQGVGQVIYSPNRATQPRQAFAWRLYFPVWFKNSLILPIASKPILTVEVQDSTGTRQRLIPIQEELSPAERLNLPLEETGSPLYFLVPAAKLAIQILPASDEVDSEYNVQVRRGSETAPSDNVMVRVGETFEIDDLSFSLSLNHNLEIVARSDPALPLYLVGGVLTVVGLLLTLMFPPIQLWLAPEVKGIGGQLYGVLEKFGSVDYETRFLEQLLTPADAQESEGEDLPANQPSPKNDGQNSSEAETKTSTP